MKRTYFLLSLIAVFGVSPLCSASINVGTIERDTLLGVPCRIYLPYKYAERVQTDKTVFPVLYLQHGMYGSEDDWTVQGDLMRLMNMLLLADQVKEMVIIMPDNFIGSLPPEERYNLMTAPDITPTGENFDTSKGSAHWRKLTSYI